MRSRTKGGTETTGAPNKKSSASSKSTVEEEAAQLPITAPSKPPAGRKRGANVGTPPKKKARLTKRNSSKGKPEAGVEEDKGAGRKAVSKRKPGSGKGKSPSLESKEMAGKEVARAASGDRPLTIVTWNVAGLRALVKKDDSRFISSDRADIVLLQETKCPEIPPGLNMDGYDGFLGETPGKVGYAGVALLTKRKPIKVQTVLDGVSEEVGAQGRLIVAEYDSFILINAYVPNSGRGLVNLQRRKLWDEFFIDYIKKLDAVKPVIYAGDLNVAHEEIDLANPKTNRNKTAGFTDQERGDFSRLLEAGFVDVYRSLNPDKEGVYTFWSRMHNARATNTGWRLDYFVVSERLMDKVIKCEVNAEIMGSDHCPVTLQIDL